MYDYIYKVKKFNMTKNQSLLDSIPIVEETYYWNLKRMQFLVEPQWHKSWEIACTNCCIIKLSIHNLKIWFNSLNVNQ